MLFSDVCAVTSPKSPTFTDPSKEKKILDGCIIRRKGKTYFSQLFETLLLHKWARLKEKKYFGQLAKTFSDLVTSTSVLVAKYNWPCTLT